MSAVGDDMTGKSIGDLADGGPLGCEQTVSIDVAQVSGRRERDQPTRAAESPISPIRRPGTLVVGGKEAFVAAGWHNGIGQCIVNLMTGETVASDLGMAWLSFRAGRSSSTRATARSCSRASSARRTERRLIRYPERSRASRSTWSRIASVPTDAGSSLPSAILGGFACHAASRAPTRSWKLLAEASSSVTMSLR